MGTQRFTHEARVRLTKEHHEQLRRLMAESNYARQGEFVRACLFGPERTAIMARQTAALAEKTHRLVAELYEAILGKTALTIPDQRAVRQLVSPATRDELDTPPPAVPPRRRIEWPPCDTT